MKINCFRKEKPFFRKSKKNMKDRDVSTTGDDGAFNQN